MGCVLEWQGDGEVADTGVIAATGCGGEAEIGADPLLLGTDQRAVAAGTGNSCLIRSSFQLL